ncbi:MAG: formylglycine-generating enzyme family protein [Treponema sp.]|nr:formylglycine-generating enzyme family protein [Treponema sp.]
MRKTLIRTLAAGTLFASLLGFVSCGSTPKQESVKADPEEMLNSLGIKMVEIPEGGFSIMTTEVTQKLYTSILGYNPSYHKGNNNPVECVSWYDAIYFCNKLSEKLGYTPVYSVDGETKPEKWGYKLNNGADIRGNITQNLNANGFRLPIFEEWVFANKEIIIEANDLDDDLDDIDSIICSRLGSIGWFSDNSENKTHPVAQKEANGYGLYDMAGNVSEYVWLNKRVDNSKAFGYAYAGAGSSFAASYEKFKIPSFFYEMDSGKYRFIDQGFRVVRSTLKQENVKLNSVNFCDSSDPEEMLNSLGIKMVEIPEGGFSIMTTEVTQKLYTSILGYNPSYHKGNNNPVECVSWYDAIYFCNRLSERVGYTPVYSVDGETKPQKWGYILNHGADIRGNITQNLNANGFRLPTYDEWVYAAKGGQNYIYSGSENLDEVGWYSGNSGNKAHPVARKKANGYGLYDMSGNVWEWCWDVAPYDGTRFFFGGSWRNDGDDCDLSYGYYGSAFDWGNDAGFRIVCSASN